MKVHERPSAEKEKAGQQYINFTCTESGSLLKIKKKSLSHIHPVLRNQPNEYNVATSEY